MWSGTSVVADQEAVATGVAVESQVEVGATTAGAGEAAEREEGVEGLMVTAGEGGEKAAEDLMEAAMATALEGPTDVVVAAEAIAAGMERVVWVAAPLVGETTSDKKV